MEAGQTLVAADPETITCFVRAALERTFWVRCFVV
jgi:hypothetical protein